MLFGCRELVVVLADLVTGGCMLSRTFLGGNHDNNSDREFPRGHHAPEKAPGHTRLDRWFARSVFIARQRYRHHASEAADVGEPGWRPDEGGAA